MNVAFYPSVPFITCSLSTSGFCDTGSSECTNMFPINQRLIVGLSGLIHLIHFFVMDGFEVAFSIASAACRGLV